MKKGQKEACAKGEGGAGSCLLILNSVLEQKLLPGAPQVLHPGPGCSQNPGQLLCRTCHLPSPARCQGPIWPPALQKGRKGSSEAPGRKFPGGMWPHEGGEIAG